MGTGVQSVGVAASWLHFNSFLNTFFFFFLWSRAHFLVQTKITEKFLGCLWEEPLLQLYQFRV